MAWFPQALLYGFWQSHLGKKRQNTKHARAWVSEIVGWNPAATDTRVLGLKGDALNLNTDAAITSNPDDRMSWDIGKVGRSQEARRTSCPKSVMAKCRSWATKRLPPRCPSPASPSGRRFRLPT